MKLFLGTSGMNDLRNRKTCNVGLKDHPQEHLQATTHPEHLWPIAFILEARAFHVCSLVVKFRLKLQGLTVATLRSSNASGKTHLPFPKQNKHLLMQVLF